MPDPDVDVALVSRRQQSDAICKVGRKWVPLCVGVSLAADRSMNFLR